ncbi:hypothetical protein [Mumia quercus]|uniref:hypothetical protein n=1 Tax=Mumia quercus TaxID=2976125 RepID=UPI0021D1246A|nr:hypothetical protein [Mumia quercus]
MKILWWLAVPLAVTALAMLWAAWYGRSRDRTRRPDDPAYARFSEAVQRPLPADVVHARQTPQRNNGVVVRRSRSSHGAR